MAYWILQHMPRETSQVTNRNIPHAAHPSGTRGTDTELAPKKS